MMGTCFLPHCCVYILDGLEPAYATGKQFSFTWVDSIFRFGDPVPIIHPQNTPNSSSILVPAVLKGWLTLFFQQTQSREEQTVESERECSLFFPMENHLPVDFTDLWRLCAYTYLMHKWNFNSVFVFFVLKGHICHSKKKKKKQHLIFSLNIISKAKQHVDFNARLQSGVHFSFCKQKRKPHTVYHLNSLY